MNPTPVMKKIVILKYNIPPPSFHPIYKIYKNPGRGSKYLMYGNNYRKGK